MTVFALDQRDELVGAAGVVGVAFLAVEGYVNSLCTNNLRGGSNQGHETGGAAHHRDEGHGVFEQFGSVEALELSHHVGVHTAGHFGVLHQFIGFGEAKVLFDSVAVVEQSGFVAFLGGLDGVVEVGVDFGGEFVLERVEIARHLVLVEVELSQRFASFEQLHADLAHSFHVGAEFDAELLAEDVDQLDGGSSGAAAEPPDVGVEDVNAVDDGHQSGAEAVAGGAVSVEVHGHLHGGFQLGDDRSGARGVNQAGHIFEGDDLGAEAFHFASFLHEVFVGEHLFGFSGFLAEEASEETGLGSFGGFGVDGVAHSAVGDAA